MSSTVKVGATWVSPVQKDTHREVKGGTEIHCYLKEQSEFSGEPVIILGNTSIEGRTWRRNTQNSTLGREPRYTL